MLDPHAFWHTIRKAAATSVLLAIPATIGSVLITPHVVAARPLSSFEMFATYGLIAIIAFPLITAAVLMIDSKHSAQQ
jgi:hypothetical protein